MKKRVLAAWGLILSMLCTMALPAQAANYGDTGEHYAREAIETWSGYGVLEGYPDGSFRPDATVTRAELAAVLDRIMGYQNKAENTFTDLPGDQWYTQYILHLAAEGIFKGNPDGTVKPDEPITRQEVFAALSRAFGLKESDEPTGFSDDATIAAWARGYLSTMKAAGYIRGDENGNIYADEPISRGEVVTVLNQMVKGFVNSDGTYSRDCQGNLVVNAHDVTLKDMTVAGNLIVADGVADGDVYLEGVTVEGDVVLRGCGENSFHILPGTNLKNVIVTKTTKGAIRLVNESGKPIPMVWVNDGNSGVVLDGDELGNVVIACDAPVTIASKKVQTVSVTGNAKVTVEKGSTVAKMDVAKTAGNASLTVNGKVVSVVNDAKIKVENNGTVGSGGSSSGGSSSGGGSGGGNSGGGSGSGGDTPATPTTISEVTLELLAPVFGESPDPADALGVGYTARTEWFNADGSAPSYRWKENAGDKDTFTADQAYQAVVTLSPVSGYAFGDTLNVTVTDGKIPAAEYTPASSVKSGDDWVVTLKYEKTEVKDYIEDLWISGPDEVVQGQEEEGVLTASFQDNRLVDPGTYTYQWYKCSTCDGDDPVRETAAARDYTIPPAVISGAQDGDELYYYVEVTAGGKTFTSEVFTVAVAKQLDVSSIQTPEFQEALRMVDDEYAAPWEKGLRYTVGLDNVIKHRNLDYEIRITYIGRTDYVDGTTREFGVDAEENMFNDVMSCYRDNMFKDDAGVHGYVTIGHYNERMARFLREQIGPDNHDEYWAVRTITITGIRVIAIPRVYNAASDNYEFLDELRAVKTYNIEENPIIYHLVRSTDAAETWPEAAWAMRPQPGPYRYTINQTGGGGSQCFVSRKEGEAWVNNITQYQEGRDVCSLFGYLKVVEAGASQERDYEIAFERYGEGDWVSDFWFDSSQCTATGAEIYLRFRPAQNRFEYYYYALDNTNAEILNGNS